MELRQELRITAAEPDFDGSPSWNLHDPATSRFFRIGKHEVEILSLMGQCPLPEIPARLAQKGVHGVTVEHVLIFIEFLQKNDLLIASDDTQRERLRAKAVKPHIFSRFLKTYLSFKIPLVKPDAFLTRTLPRIEWVFSTQFRNAVLLLGAVGVLLVLQQWEAFFNTLPQFFSFEGFVAYALSLSILKIIHELGHAYTAKRYGCNVPTMGICILIFYPVLYTDTTDAWKLPRNQRIRIGLAGMAIELALAAICLFLWPLLPDGILRSVCFLFSTTTIIMTLLVNLNPLMRFDGYYVLSDAMGIANLQSRATQLLMWKLRSFVMAQAEVPPERPDRRILIYAICSAIYRFSLTLSIALAIYHTFFKVLGAILLTMQLTMFIVIPATKCTIFLWQNRKALRTDTVGKSYAGGLVAVIMLFFLPWNSAVIMPATLHAKNEFAIYAPAAGYVAALNANNGDTVQKDEPVIDLQSQELDTDIRKLAIKLDNLRWQASSIQFGKDYQNQIKTIKSDLEASQQRMQQLQEQKAKNHVTAPFKGRITDMDPGLETGSWVDKDEPLMRIIDPDTQMGIAFASEENTARIEPGMTGYFYPRYGGGDRIAVIVTSVSTASEQALSDRNHASTYGGDIPVRHTQGGELIPLQAVMQVELAISNDNDTKLLREQVGHVRISGIRESLAGRIIRHVIGVLQRESGI